MPGLSKLLQSKRFFVAPGVYDGISTRIAAKCGFEAVYMSGYCVSASLGCPDVGLATYKEFVDRVSLIRDLTDLPLIADADNGFGGLSNVQRTVRGYERAGADAIQIEDQDSPRRCGHTENKKLIEPREMVAKIRVAVESRRSADTLLIARSDALAVEGLEGALLRCEMYARAGADILFVDAPESERQMREIAGAFDIPMMINVVPGGKGPVFTPGELEEMGFAFAIYPSLPWTAAAGALRSAYASLIEVGTSENARLEQITVAEGHELSGFPDFWRLEKRYAELSLLESDE